MQRYQSLRSQMLSSFCKIANTALREEAITHTLGVADAAILLAHRRKLNIEWCASAALLHDISIYLYNSGHSMHAQKSAQYAEAWLNQNHFLDEEIEAIIKAIKNHSNKDRKDDDYSEALKDADVFARYLQEDLIPASQQRRIRLIQLTKELQLM